MKKVKWVSVVDDDASVRHVVKMWIGGVTGFRIKSEYALAEDALRALPEDRPDLVVLDVRMGTMCGLECLHRLRPLLPFTRIVLFTAFGGVDVLHHAITGGANGLVRKDGSPRTLVWALQRATLDGLFLPRERMISLPVLVAAVRVAACLTPRERSLLARVAGGWANKRIAAKLGLNANYVARRLSELYQKLGVTNRAGAVVKALELGIRPLQEEPDEG